MLNYPRTCVWEVTMGCNMNCKHCGSSCAHALPGELSTEEGYKFIDMCSDVGVEWVSISGGEPFMRKDLLSLVKRLEEREILVNIITNGWLINPQIADELQKIGGLRVVISLDGPQEIHDSIRKIGSFERAEKSFEMLSKRNIQTGCITTITRRNIDSLGELKKFLILKGVECWQVQIGLPMGNLAQRCDWVLVPEETNTILDFCHQTAVEGKIDIYPADCIGYYDPREAEIYKKIFDVSMVPEWEGCHAGIRSFGMLHDGNVVGCTSIRDKKFIEGNIKQRTLREIWEDPKSFKWRRGFKKENLIGDCKKCKHAEKCLGGCPNTRYTINGDMCSENLFCSYNLLMKKEKKADDCVKQR